MVQTLDDGAFRFLRPDGRSFESPVPASTRESNWTQLVTVHHAEQIHITASTAITGWTGEAFENAQAVNWLLRNAGRAKNVSAETSWGEQAVIRAAAARAGA